MIKIVTKDNYNEFNSSKEIQNSVKQESTADRFDWFVVDDDYKSKFYDDENLDEVRRYAKFYYRNYRNFNSCVRSIVINDLENNHSDSFINAVLREMDNLHSEKAVNSVDPYDLALKYFDKSYTDKEIKDDLVEKGYSYDFIQQVFDYLEDIYEDSENY